LAFLALLALAVEAARLILQEPGSRLTSASPIEASGDHD